MQIPVINGTMRRRILANFRADPDVVRRLLPPPFEPKLHGGHAVVGICLIHLDDVRAAAFPLPLGLSSENAAHRFAVAWMDDEGRAREGVFVPRRDTDSLLNHLAGGRFFPGQHHRAHFTVVDDGQAIDFQMRAEDGDVEVRLRGRIAPSLPEGSIFGSLGEASVFFEAGSVGYSTRSDTSDLDGIVLKTDSWRVDPLSVTDLYSSYFSDTNVFPMGSVTFDHALIMRNIAHQWHSAPALAVSGLSNKQVSVVVAAAVERS